MKDPLLVSYQFCGQLSRREAKNFYYSFLVLPAPLRRSMCALYAFMRHTDDLADEPDPNGDPRGRLDGWRRMLGQALAGQGGPDDWPGMLALVDTVRRHGIPSRYLEEVIDGVEMDLEPRTFETFEDLHAYCYRVASVVGLSCIKIWGYRSEGGRAEELAEACGIALQLTNIIRDVREDALRGRVYLPIADLERFGVTREDLLGERTSEQLRALLEFEANRAQAFYEKAAPLEQLVDPVGRPVLRALTGIYQQLLNKIVARRYEVLSRRISLSPWRKAAITVRSFRGRPASLAAKPAEAPRC